MAFRLFALPGFYRLAIDIVIYEFGMNTRSDDSRQPNESCSIKSRKKFHWRGAPRQIIHMHRANEILFYIFFADYVWHAEYAFDLACSEPKKNNE